MESPSDGPTTPAKSGQTTTPVADAITAVIPVVTVLDSTVTTVPADALAASEVDAGGEGSLLAPLPTIGALRRERAALIDCLQEAQYDLGGLLMEMGRRELFNHGLAEIRARDAVAIERRVVAIDDEILATRKATRPAPGAVDDAGDDPAPPLGRACALCHAALAPEVNFCGLCGTARGAA